MILLQNFVDVAEHVLHRGRQRGVCGRRCTTGTARIVVIVITTGRGVCRRCRLRHRGRLMHFGCMR